MSLYTTVGIPATNVYTVTASSTKADVTTDAKSTIYSVHISNTTAATAYLQVFDLQSGSVTVGSTAPTYAFGVPAGGVANLHFGRPIEHSTGFTIASTTTRTGSSTAAQEVTIIYTHSA